MKVLSWSIPIFLMFWGIAWGSEVSSTEGPGGRTFKVPLYTASRVEVSLWREFPGTVEARVRARLSSKVAGFLKEVRVEEGDRVKKGDLLLKIEDREIRDQIKALRAGLLAARKDLAEVSARLAFARAEFERYRKLFKEEAVTAQEFEAKKAEYEALSAKKEALSARLKELQARLSASESLLAYTTLRSPFEGRVLRKWIDPGSFVSPGQPLLEIEDLASGKRVVFHPEEALLAAVKPGLEVFVRFPAEAKTLKVKVTEVVPEVDPRTRTFTAKADLPKDFRVWSGTYAQVLVPTGKASRLLVPKAALVNRGGFYGVFVPDENGVIHFRVLRLGKVFYREGNEFFPGCLKTGCEAYVEILSGLRPGERVVLEPPEGIREGDRVAEEA